MTRPGGEPSPSRRCSSTPAAGAPMPWASSRTWVSVHLDHRGQAGVADPHQGEVLGDAQAPGAQVAHQQGGQGVVAGHGGGGPAGGRGTPASGAGGAGRPAPPAARPAAPGAPGAPGLLRGSRAAVFLPCRRPHRRRASRPGPRGSRRAGSRRPRIPRHTRLTGTEEGDPAVAQRAQVPGGDPPPRRGCPRCPGSPPPPGRRCPRRPGERPARAGQGGWPGPPP